MSGAPIVRPFGNKWPRIAPSAFVAPGACLIGDVEIRANASVWYNCVLRADINRIVIGAGSNIQDGTVIHVEDDPAGGPGLPALVGDNVLVGHMAVLHGCVLEPGAFVGMASVVMDGSRIGRGGMLAAGALLPPGKAIGAGELWTGRPAAFRRQLSPSELEAMARQTARYVETAAAHRASVPEGSG